MNRQNGAAVLLASHQAKGSSRRMTLRAAAIVAVAASATISYADVTLTTTSVNGASVFPGTPVIATAPPNYSPNVPENLDNGRIVTQVFTPTSNFTLDKISFVSTGGPGDGGTSITSIHLYELVDPPAANYPGSYDVSTQTVGPATDLLGGGAGLPLFMPGFGDLRFVDLDFGGADQVALVSGKRYAFEIWGTEGFVGATFPARCSGAGPSGGNPYAGGDGYTSAGGGSTNLRTQLAGNSRDVLLGIYAVPSGPTNAAWAVDADGNWSLATNWTPSAPNAAGAVANFGAIITAPRTVTVDAAETTGTVNFDNAFKYTIGGTNTLTLDNSTAPVGINVVTGSHDITAPLVLAKDTVVTVTPVGSTLSLGSLQASTVGITKAGAGNLAVNNVRAGSLTVNAGKVSVIAGRSTAGTSNVKNLSVAGGATLDLNDQDLVYDYSGATPIATVRSLLVSGYNGGAWNGTGINSSAANAHNAVPGAHTVALGYVEGSTAGISGSFSGQTLTDATNVLIRYTYSGDANIDGTVDTIDFNQVAANFSGSSKDWNQGDFNYDGTVDSVDFNLLASNFGQVRPGAASQLGGLVPEPATGGLIVGALSVLGLARRRRK